MEIHSDLVEEIVAGAVALGVEVVVGGAVAVAECLDLDGAVVVSAAALVHPEETRSVTYLATALILLLEKSCSKPEVLSEVMVAVCDVVDAAPFRA